MNQNKTAVSVIMPVYNSEKYLSACVESILAQEFEDYELLLIDDGSSDGSPAICDAFARRDTRVKAFHKANGGICEARNYGMARASGEYIAFSDHDDIVLPGFLSENYRAAVENHADLVKFGRKGLLIRDEKVISCSDRRFADQALTHAELAESFFDLRLNGTMNCVWDGFFRREFLEKNDIRFDTRYRKGGEDIDFCSRCMIRADRILLRSPVYYEHYIRIGISTSTVEDPERMLKYKYLADNLQACAQAAGISPDRHEAEYLTCIVREQVYPSVKYLLQTGKSSAEIRACLREIADTREIPEVSPAKLRRVPGKWGIFARMFCRRQYRRLILLVRINLLRKKAAGDTT